MTGEHFLNFFGHRTKTSIVYTDVLGKQINVFQLSADITHKEYPCHVSVDQFIIIYIYFL